MDTAWHYLERPVACALLLTASPSCPPSARAVCWSWRNHSTCTSSPEIRSTKVADFTTKVKKKKHFEWNVLNVLRYSYKHRHRKSDWIASFVPSRFTNGKLLCGWRFTRYLLFVCWYLSERPKKRERKWTGIKNTLFPSINQLTSVLITLTYIQ